MEQKNSFSFTAMNSRLEGAAYTDDPHVPGTNWPLTLSGF